MVKKKLKTTAVQWTWRSDQNTWISFDADTSSNLEAEFQKGSKKVKVDKERFIDFSGTQAEILKNFSKMDHDDEVVGMQRRYDDEMKRRAIRRFVPQFFSADVFLLLGSFSKAQLTEFTTDIELYGGVISKKLTKKVTLVICDEGDVENNEEDCKMAAELKVPILSRDFITDSISEGKRADLKNYKVEYEFKKAEKKKEVEEKKDAKKPANKRKKKDESSEDEEEKPVKAAKKEEKEEKKAEPKKAEPKKAEEKKAEPKKEEKKEEEEESMEIEQYDDSPQYKRNTQWMGTCTMESDGSTFPQVMVVQSRKGNTISGEIHWPTLNSAKTKFRGTIKGDHIEHEEYEVIVGADDVVIPAKYTGEISGDNISGKLVTDDEETACSFSLNKIPATPAKEMDIIKNNVKFEGMCYQPFPFSFEITSRKGVKVEGSITWPTLNNTKTKVRGTIEGDEIEFEEYESTTDEVAIPVKYVGRVLKNMIKGKFKGEEAHGNFEMGTK